MKTSLKHQTVKISRFLSQASLVLLITIALAEVGLRAYNHVNPSFVFYADSYNRFRGKPHSSNFDFQLNSKGFKDEETRAKQDDVYRILGIGDSFTFGIVPYEHNYLTLLERKLQEKPFNAEIINFGIPSIGPEGYLSLFLHEGLELEPDLLLLSFFVGNDFVESYPRNLRSYSYVASLIHFFYSLFKNYQGQIIQDEAEYCDDCPTFAKDEHLKVQHNRSFIFHKDSPMFSEFFEQAMVHLKNINEICKEKEIELVIAVIPAEIQINAQLEASVLKIFYPGITADEWDITQPNKRLILELDRLGINSIDLYEYFVEDSTAQYYKPQDSHWNIAGNELATEAIYNHLVNMCAINDNEETVPSKRYALGFCKQRDLQN